MYLNKDTKFIYYFKTAFSDPNGDDISCRINGYAWISMDDCIMSATPNVDGTFAIILVVCDIYQFCLSKNLTLVVKPSNIKPFLNKPMPNQ